MRKEKRFELNEKENCLFYFHHSSYIIKLLLNHFPFARLTGYEPQSLTSVNRSHLLPFLTHSLIIHTNKTLSQPLTAVTQITHHNVTTNNSTQEKLTRKIDKIVETGRHFSKIASSYQFENDATSYLQWVIRFEAEMENFGFRNTLTTNPEAVSSSPKLSFTDRIAQQQQKTVYHMILRCVPKDATLVVTRSLPVEQHTAFGAWLALREFYIGEERAYIARLEEKFNSLQWDEGELWPSFETRFDSLVNDLQAIGQHKDEYQKKIRLMTAIQQSGRKDAEGGSVYSRLHVTNLIKQGESYRTWLVAIRTEAQKIQDEIQSSKGKKHKRDDHKDSNSERVGEVSLVDSSISSSASSQHPPFIPNKRPKFNPGRSSEPCRNFRNGHCRFGDMCRFSHDRSFTNKRTTNFNNYARRTKIDKPCFNFREGKCTRGDQCRYMHVTGASERISSSSTSTDAMAMIVEAYNIESDKIILKSDTPTSSSSNRTHRTILDSACSDHLTCRREWLRDLRPLTKPITVRGAFGKTTTATHCGDMHLSIGDNDFVVMNVIYCDAVQDTLLSLIMLLKSGHIVDFKEMKLLPKSSSFSIALSMVGNILSFANEPSRARLVPTAEAFVLTRSQRKQPQSTPTAAATSASPSPSSIPTPTTPPESDFESSRPITPTSSLSREAHLTYGHLCGRKLDELIENSAADGMIIHKKDASHSQLIRNCDACMAAKMGRKSFSDEMNHQVEGPNDKAVADLCGPITTRIIDEEGQPQEKKQYISLITDV